VKGQFLFVPRRHAVAVVLVILVDHVYENGE